MRLIGLVILLVGLVLVATVNFALYGLPLLLIGAATLAVARYQQKMTRIKRQEAARIAPSPEEWQPTARRKRTEARPSRPASRPTQRREPPSPHRETPPPVRRRQPAEPRQDREPTLATGRFEPLYDGEESGVLFHDMRAEISAQAKRSLAALGRAGYIIRAKTDRVTISRDNRTEVLRSNAAIVDFAKQLGLMGD